MKREGFTKKYFEESLNEIPIPFDDLKDNGGRIPRNSKYGTWLRNHDPIAFNIAYREYNIQCERRKL